MVRRAVAAALFLLTAAARPALAQDGSQAGTRRIAFDTVVATDDFFRTSADWPTQVLFDSFVSVQPRSGWQVAFRPVIWRVDGNWELLADYLAVRYEAGRSTRWRVEAGRFPSPMGYGMTENRANLNAGVIWCHRPYYMPLPPLGGDLPSVSLVSAVYPNGAQVVASRNRWDARAAVVDRAPVEYWVASAGSSRSPNAIVGFGVSPRQGLRFGVASAWGAFAAATQERPAQHYAMFNVEGEYAIGHAKVSGEWVRDRFETPFGDRVAQGWTLQAQRTLTPRLVAHARASFVRAPVADAAGGSATIGRLGTLDATMGYRLSPELTVRASYSAIKGWTTTAIDHQVGVSAAWSRRWW